MKKKIGIITFHNAHNYGAVLQTYALQKILLNDNDVQIINYKNKAIENTYKLFKVNKENIFALGKSIIGDFLFFYKDKKRFDCFNDFISKNFNLTKEFNNYESLKNNPPKFDVYITGSDQVWNYDISRDVDAYTLNFGDKNIKKLSYAASIGEDKLSEKHIEHYMNNIKKLDYISVREEQTKPYLEKLTGKEVSVTCDPTLLRTVEEWNNDLRNLENEIKEKYIFAYVVEENEEFYKILNYLSDVTGYKVIHTGRRNKKIKNILKNAYTKSPFEFVNLIKNAEYVVATSFHATVFSIIFHKNFWVIPHLKTGGRVQSLLNKLKITERSVSTLEDFLKLDYKNKINYDDIDRILENLRNESKKWLNYAIENK